MSMGSADPSFEPAAPPSEADLRRQLAERPGSAAAQGALGRLLVARGNAEEAVPLLRQAVEDATEFSACCFPLLIALIGSGRCEQALAFMDRYPEGVRAELRFHLHKEAVLAERFDVVEALWNRRAAAPVERLIDGFWKAVVLYREGRHDDAVANFHGAAALGRALWQQGLRYPFIAHFTQFGATLADAKEMAEIEAQPPILGRPVEWLQDEQPGAARTGPVVVMGCDEGYFVRFAENCLSGLAEGSFTARCHFHVVGCGADGQGLIRRLRDSFPGLHLGFTAEPAPASAHLVHYASCRFFVAAELMDHYRSDLVITDVDSRPTRNIHALSDLMVDHDVGAFANGMAMPWLAFAAGLVWCRDTEATRRFLQLSAGIIRRRIDKSPLWMLDQAALFCAKTYLQSHGALRFRDFRASTGWEVGEVLETIPTAEEKRALRVSGDGWAGGQA